MINRTTMLSLAALLLASCSPERMFQLKQVETLSPSPEFSTTGDHEMANLEAAPSNDSASTLPAIDAASPAKFETATFAMG